MAMATLPRIIEYLDVYDGGPCDDGPTAVCPHCGADGRYIHYFRCDDGTERGAMAGCIKLFPVSPVADAHKRLATKQAQYARKGWGLNSWDTKAMAAIQAYYAGEHDEAATIRTLANLQAQAQAWRRQRGRR